MAGRLRRTRAPWVLPALLVAVLAALAGWGALQLARVVGRDGPSEPLGCEGRACQVNQDGRADRRSGAPSVVVNAADPAHVVVTDVDESRQRCGWHVSFDAGRSWRDGDFELPPGFRSCQPDSGGLAPAGNLAMGPSGTLYATLTSTRVVPEGEPGEGESVLMARSTDGGRTFAPATVAVPAGPPDVAWLRPTLATASDRSGADRLMVTFWGCRPPVGDSQGLCDRAMLAQSFDGGASFSPPVVVNDPPGANSPSAPVLAPDGTLYVAFLRRFNDGVADLLVARSGDGGSSFEVTRVERQPGLGRRYDPARLALSPDGASLYITYQDARDGRSDVWFRRSLDQGRTWGEPVRLSQEQAVASYLPGLSVAPAGRVDVAFYQRGPGSGEDVQWTYSLDGGQSFAADLRLNDERVKPDPAEQGGASYHPPALASLDDAAYVVWTGARPSGGRDSLMRVNELGRPVP